MITWENAVHAPETNIMRVQCVMERNRVCATFLISMKAISAAVIHFTDHCTTYKLR